MTGYQFIGRFMQEVTTLCHHIMVWPQTKTKRGEHQHTQGHTRKRVIEATKLTAETRDPPARIPEITESSRSGITFTLALRSKHRQRRVATRVVKNE